MDRTQQNISGRGMDQDNRLVEGSGCDPVRGDGNNMIGIRRRITVPPASVLARPDGCGRRVPGPATRSR
jgi:hypothetical protein